MPTLVQTQYTEYGYPAGTMTVAVPGTTAGNMLLVVVMAENTTQTAVYGTPTDGANTYSAIAAATQSNAQQGGTQMQAWMATGIAGGTVSVSVGVTGSGASTIEGIYVFEISGASSFDVAQEGAGTQVGSSAITTGAFSTSQPNEIAVAVATLSGGTPVAGTGYTLIAQTAPLGFALMDGALASSGAQAACTITGTTYVVWTLQVLTFYGATAGPPANPGPVGIVNYAAGW